MRAIFVPCYRAKFFVIEPSSLAFGRDHPLRARAAMRKMKDCLASWHHSAHTAANARSSKVIDRRIRDARCVASAKISSTREKNIKALSVLAART
jgi:hypothetical protein